MTASRAPAEPEVREFEATVESVDDRAIVLDETYFYAESGGQPADRGTIDGILLADVIERDGRVVHILDQDAETLPEAGETVSAVVDDAFRTYCTRAHTASHVLYGAARRTCDDLGYAGFDISATKVRVDLTTAEPLDDADLVELERLANRAVWDSLPVSWEALPEDEARAVDGIAFNTKTEEGAMSGSEAVRVVTVGERGGERDGEHGGENAPTWDVAACGGTHVRNTSEIGPISVLDRSNPGEGVTRVEFAVGPTAIDREAAVHAAALDAATALDAQIGDLPDAVDRLRERADRLEADLQAATADLLAARLREFPVNNVDADGDDGATWAVGTVDDADPNDLREPAQRVLAEADAPDAIAAVGTGDSPFVVAAVAEEAVGGGDDDNAPNAGAVVDAVTDEFGGGGGGGPTFAQGGGLDADPDAVVAWLRDR
ncbi:alanyl-tRNA editing protein [Halorubrum lacusprofundi]|jgi:alanyl-tRNA synthetase|uniref:alanine--tRNA ligase n=1 Tax=Halorubrum lacusprofundi (strain ATCC 49239 / DSM 5036 / JCM 8891 / ACAM 34) TaxID=416348 RepID=B9LT99_HALLT|nr:alanine--tRNA ligase-related protein [Halorubrum lacusprofundi]ACM58071.1 Threonyl/alanyl tRNA synthetase SAD [Halorubrum lacusprofundi ATCC 49239]MCG1006154.1 alanine--tRNA ligase-related protein [Halorubrum lacusprofundi]